MKKSDRIHAFVAELGTDTSVAYDPRYQGYFRCFNAGQYYEAHDVLEDLWLGCNDTHFAYYKGLIQIAGAFVHLRKQFLRPDHPVDGRRLGPAVRLFRLGHQNLAGFQPEHLSLDVESLLRYCSGLAEGIVQSDFTRNPWSPENMPEFHLTIDSNGVEGPR